MSRWPFLDHDGPIPIAHRGGALEGPENTMAAFAAAIDLGFRYVETDVHATRDGVLVAFHDEGLKRLSGRPEAIADLAWRDLETVRVGGGHAIPRFEDLLEAWPDLRIAVDPKHDQATVPLIDVLQRSDAIGRVCVGSFSGRRLATARQLGGPQLCTGLSPKEVGQLQAASAGLPMRIKAGACAQVPPTVKGVPLVHQRFVDAAHDQGLAVHVWTIDDAEEMQRLLDIGVDGIMTDRPTVLRDVLMERGTWN
ncbi:MAG: glycerophosphodiester phosphodiesterase [bacterium]|nr:glycerophosphodiester phosphodiesterase [bacterium]MDE0615191.1 glycerophosphodiester phosphodiesterase [bacterium]MXZ84365.1 glycerophosphodiester phosphodiesterase [Acidimicrobiia bacterium]MYG72893.1 glycerophosphodiester phosphodiesterase [Acidimicrobiia bacterium]MYH96232.1 glycerophosphodiester phosphodiesterase [Acidimicrobiia bacterium]